MTQEIAQPGARNHVSGKWSAMRRYLLVVIRIAVVALVLAGAWYAFMWLVEKKPVEASSALVMTWATVGVLLLALFPRILERLKKLKFGDFEVELQASVSQATPRDFILPPARDEDLLFTEKGSFDDLQAIIEQADMHSNIPILLTVNVRDGGVISSSMLFTYLFLLEIYSLSVIVLFIRDRGHPRKLPDIDRSSVLGAMPGSKALWAYYRRFPSLLRVFGEPRGIPPQDRPYSPYTPDSRIVSVPFIRGLHAGVREAIRITARRDGDDEGFLSATSVRDWFRGLLSTRFVDGSLTETDIRALRDALQAEDDFILLTKDGCLSTVIFLCRLASKLSARAISSE